MTQRTNIRSKAPGHGNHAGAPAANHHGEEVEIAGKTVRRVDMRSEMNRAMQENPDPENPHANAMNPGPLRPSQTTREEIDRAVPDFLRDQEPGQAATPQAGQPAAQQGSNPSDAVSLDQPDMANVLMQRIKEAQQDGRDEAAKELQDMLSKMLGNLGPTRVRKKKAAHPALLKLKRNLGLERIKPVIVPWCDIDWHVAPPPATLDRWVAGMVEQGLGTYAAFKLAASITGLDGAPLYEVFGLDIRASFVPPADPGEPEGEPVVVRLYEKRCDGCGEILEVDAKDCFACGTLHDPFDMPLNLRVRCAEMMNRHFAENFGPYEDLQQLLVKVRAEMPDRVDSKEKLYPFPELLPTSSSTTDTTPTGAAQ